MQNNDVMNIFKKLLKIGQAEIHALVEKMEDPISLTQQGINELHEQLEETTENFTKARALVIRTENEIESKREEASSYAHKAKLLLEKAEQKEIEPALAEKLALQALSLKKKLIIECDELSKDIESYKQKALEINNNIEVLKFNISKWEKELATLRAKQKLNAATLFANQQIANIDRNSTIEMLEKLKNKTKEEESIVQSMTELAKEKIDSDIDFVLNQSSGSLQQELEELKKQLKS